MRTREYFCNSPIENKMKGYMYILHCANDEYYVGSTNDLNTRMTQHNNGEGSNFTSKHLPATLIYSEKFETVAQAFRREQQIKGWSRKKKEALIAGDIEKLKFLSRNYTEFRKSGYKKIDILKENIQTVNTSLNNNDAN
jgi:putative endonuclease